MQLTSNEIVHRHSGISCDLPSYLIKVAAQCIHLIRDRTLAALKIVLIQSGKSQMDFFMTMVAKREAPDTSFAGGRTDGL